MSENLFTKNTVLYASIMATMFIIMSIPIALADTPPYYAGPVQGYVYSEDEYIICAQVGVYDYSNPPTAPFPCALHQAYSYALGDMEFYGSLTMNYAGWDSSSSLVYDDETSGSAYCYYYAWESNVYDVITGATQSYRNTQTQQIVNPPAAAALLTG